MSERHPVMNSDPSYNPRAQRPFLSSAFESMRPNKLVFFIKYQVR